MILIMIFYNNNYYKKYITIIILYNDNNRCIGLILYFHIGYLYGIYFIYVK